MSEACKGCDGKGDRIVGDKDNVLKAGVKRTCSRCGGSRKEPKGPPKQARGFRRAAKSEDDDNDLNRAADLFLARHGYGKNGR